MSNQSLIRLLTWLSPAFPIGGYAWSSGLETACQNGCVTDKLGLQRWILTSLSHGNLRNDAIFLAAVYRQEQPITELNELALSMAGSKERYEETTGLGGAFIEASEPWRSSSPDSFPNPIAYPIAIGCMALENEIPLGDTMTGFFQASTNNQIQAALRLIKLGQKAGVELLAELEAEIQRAALTAENSNLSKLGAAAISMEIAAMNHETLPSRIFRS
ncbi:MAG: urease accessory protein UreF [Rhizobiaceae bacterium]